MNFLEQLNQQLQPDVPLGAREEDHVAEEIVAICVEDHVRINGELKREFIDSYEGYFTDPELENLHIFEDSTANFLKFKEMPTI